MSIFAFTFLRMKSFAQQLKVTKLYDGVLGPLYIKNKTKQKNKAKAEGNIRRKKTQNIQD